VITIYQRDRMEITKQELEDMYWGQNLSLNEISKITNINKTKIYRELKPIRTISESQSRAIPILTQYEIGYILGVSWGDGWISGRNGKNHFMYLEAKDMDFIENFWIQSKKLNPSIITKRKNRSCFSVHFSHKNFCDYIKSLQPLSLKHESVIGFIEGFIDSEAFVSNMKYYDSPQGKKPYRKVVIHNTNLSKQTIIQLILKRFDIDSTIRSRTCKTKFSKFKDFKTYDLAIENKKSLINFHNNFHFSIKRKQDRLDAIVKSYKERG